MERAALWTEKPSPVVVNAKKIITKSNIYSCHDDMRMRSDGVLNDIYSFCENGAKSRTPDLLKRSIKICEEKARSTAEITDASEMPCTVGGEHDVIIIFDVL